MEDIGRIHEVGEELAIVAAPLIGNTRPLCYPLAYGGIQFGLAPLAGPDHPVTDGNEAIREGILQTGILTALLALQEPIPLIGFLEGLVDAIVW